LKNYYDVVIVGAGPAGIFTALELISKSNLRVTIIEKGKDIEKRTCYIEISGKCLNCKICDMLNGWGGAGAFSDGKLNLSPEIGGFLMDYVPKEELINLIDYVDEIYVRMGAPQKIYAPDKNQVEKIKKLASKCGLIFIPTKIRHIGTEKCKEILKSLKEIISKRADIIFENPVLKILTSGEKVKGVKLGDGTEILADYIVVAPGRAGSSWLETEAKRLGLPTKINPVDIGVRVEIPASVMEELTLLCYEPKFLYYSKTFDDPVRTFCVNPYGEVIIENIEGIWTVNGHSYSYKKTDNTNFAILCSTYFTEPFKDPILYGKGIAKLANLLGREVLVQRLGDIKKGRRSTEARILRNPVKPSLKIATPGDISFVLPYRYLVNILEMIEALDKIAPGINSPYTLLYGVEVKFYSIRFELNNSLETRIKNLFIAGDGAGITRGLIQASVSGIIIAREIIKRSLNKG